MVRVLNCIEKWIFKRRLFNETFQNQDTPCWLMKESVTSYNNGSWPPEKYTLLDQNSSEENITITILIKYLAHCYLHWLVAFRRHTVTALKCMVEAFTCREWSRTSNRHTNTDTPTKHCLCPLLDNQSQKETLWNACQPGYWYSFNKLLQNYDKDINHNKSMKYKMVIYNQKKINCYSFF